MSNDQAARKHVETMFEAYSERLSAIVEHDPFSDFSAGRMLIRDLCRELLLFHRAYSEIAPALVRLLDAHMKEHEELSSRENPDEDDEESGEVISDYWNSVERAVYALQEIGQSAGALKTEAKATKPRKTSRA